MPEYNKTYTNLIWQNWLSQSEFKPLDRWLKAWFKQNRDISRQQKLNLSQAMFSAMRFVQTASYLEQSFSQNQTVTHLFDWDKTWQLADIKQVSPDSFWCWIQTLHEYHQLPELDALSAHFSRHNNKALSRRQDWFAQYIDNHSLSQVESDLLCGIRPGWQPLLTQRALYSGWSETHKQDFIQAILSAPPLWLRLNPSELATDKQANELIGNLTKQGIRAIKNESGILVTGGKDITQSPEYKQGLFEIQDLASQQIALAVNAKPGQKVWDTCAGAGGKSLAIAAKMKNKGSVVATDLHEYKLSEIKKRAKRAGLFNIRSFAWDGASKLRLPKEAAQQKGFDWVLIDAPCTSAGTWRRNPDAKWRFNETDTQEQLAIQQQILSYAHYAVRVEGFLVYATCSWQISENEAQVADFLSKHAHFKLVEQHLLGAPEQNSDTMFVAVMQKMA